MRYALIVLACATLILFAGCGHSTPDTMIASIYAESAYSWDHTGHLTPGKAKPIITWLVPNASLVQKIYQHLSALPAATPNGKNICGNYGEVLTFQTGSIVLSQVYSEPCYDGLYITTLSGEREADQEFRQLIQQATGFHLEPDISGHPIPTPTP
jgi:hypothetical protein